MALDLYINNERTANSSLFYRVTSTSLYTWNIKLSDVLIPNGDLSQYNVEYSFNNSVTKTTWAPDENGFYTLIQQVNISTPRVSSIQVYVSDANDLSAAVTTYAFSGIVVPYFPVAQFISYPSLYVNIDTAVYRNITSTNYKLSSRGNFFYGEGHTEVINLSSNNYSSSNNTANWFIGNTITDLVTSAAAGTIASVLSTDGDNRTATVTITSEIGSYPKYPIGLLFTNSYITTAGPIITYNDTTGKKYYYPFFTSTLSADDYTEVTDTLKSSIRVLQYPEKTNIVVTHFPFIQTHFYLPFDYSKSTLVTVTDTKNVIGDALEETFAGTKWQLQAFSKTGDWSTETAFLSTVFAYKFSLLYEKDTSSTSLLPFKASAIYPTTLFLNLTSYRNCRISLPSPAPQDWNNKLVPVTNSLSAVINAIPFDKIYTPNYYNIKGEDVGFTIISTPPPPYVIEQLELKSDFSDETLILSTTNLSGTMKFNTLGVVDLSATYILRNATTNNIVDASLVYQDLIEIINTYDKPAEEAYFHTASTPLVLTYPSQPKLSPNEWAVADNVNSLIEKIYTTAEELFYRSKTYKQRNKWYGYLEPAEKVSVAIIPDQYEWYLPPRIWVDLDCTDGTVTDETASWAVYESNFNELSSTWEWQDCGSRIKIDPSCYQKYCVQWKWESRAKGSSPIDITWGDTKIKNAFQKRWKWEKCTVDAVNINCDRTKWNISTIDSDVFPFPTSNITDRCAIIDAEVSVQTNQIVLAHRTELHLIDKDYYCNHTARTAMADDLFSFQNIVGLTTTTGGKVVVLDSTLPRVCVFTINKNNFTSFSNWGGYGLKDTPQGLKNPLDIHVDVHDSIWIADTGNYCIKKFTLTGKPLMVISHSKLDEYPPLSVCVDSKDYIHCLTSVSVIVFDEYGNYLYEYYFDSQLDGPVSKINVSYNKEVIYITYQFGIAKHFRNGVFFGYLLKDIVCKDGYTFEQYNSISQDEFRNVYITAGDKILQVGDLQEIVNVASDIPADLYWNLEDLYVHKEEYIQPWVYLKCFHRLWDNIELLRNSLYYDVTGNCKSYVAPTYSKQDLVIGQNEIVTNAVINRLVEQLWTNLQSIINYFDPDCEN